MNSRPTAQAAREIPVNEGLLLNWAAAYRRDHADKELALDINERARPCPLTQALHELSVSISLVVVVPLCRGRLSSGADDTGCWCWCWCWEQGVVAGAGAGDEPEPGPFGQLGQHDSWVRHQHLEQDRHFPALRISSAQRDRDAGPSDRARLRTNETVNPLLERSRGVWLVSKSPSDTSTSL